MALMFTRPPAPEPPGLILSVADARRQRARSEARARAARAMFRDLLASRLPAR